MCFVYSSLATVFDLMAWLKGERAETCSHYMKPRGKVGKGKGHPATGRGGPRGSG